MEKVAAEAVVVKESASNVMINIFFIFLTLYRMGGEKQTPQRSCGVFFFLIFRIVRTLCLDTTNGHK